MAAVRDFNVFHLVRAFADDECGAITVDMMPIMMFGISLGVAVTGEVAEGVKGRSNDLALTLAYGFDTGSGGSAIFGALDGWARSDDLAYAQAESATPLNKPGNPGNERDVGNAGENPNGQGGWGGGSKGRSDG